MKRREQLTKLSEMSINELKEQAESLKESLFRLKFRKTLGAGQTAADIRREKKTLARVNTIIKQKEGESAKTEA